MPLCDNSTLLIVKFHKKKSLNARVEKNKLLYSGRSTWYDVNLTIAANTKHLCNIYAMLEQRWRRWPDVLQMLYKCCVSAVYTLKVSKLIVIIFQNPSSRILHLSIAARKTSRIALFTYNVSLQGRSFWCWLYYFRHKFNINALYFILVAFKPRLSKWKPNSFLRCDNVVSRGR